VGKGGVERGADGQVQDDHVVRLHTRGGGAVIQRILAQVLRDVLEFGKDFGIRAPRSKQRPQYPRLVADGVALAEAGAELVEGAHEEVIRDP
jgi:hypothetical protein